MKTTYKDLEGDRPQRTLRPWGHLDFKATENCLKQGTFACVLLLSKPMLTAYEQPSCSLHLNRFTDQSLAVSFISELRLLRPW